MPMCIDMCVADPLVIDTAIILPFRCYFRISSSGASESPYVVHDRKSSIVVLGLVVSRSLAECLMNESECNSGQCRSDMTGKCVLLSTEHERLFCHCNSFCVTVIVHSGASHVIRKPTLSIVVPSIVVRQ